MSHRFSVLALTLALSLMALVAAPARAAVIQIVPPTASTPAIPVYIARPPGNGPFPAVLLLHGCAGFDGLLAIGADRLAAHGYVGAALDVLGPHGMQTACNGPSDGDEAGAARAVLAWLRTQPYVMLDKLAVIGFSMGADAALTLIDTPGSLAPVGLQVAAVYYPSCTGRDGLVRVPLHIFDGSADQIAPPAPCAAMAKAGAAAGKPIAITTYPGATHGFDVPGPDHDFYGTKVHFDPAAALDSAQQILQLLARYLGP